MSATLQRLPLAEAKQIAIDLARLLEPACERIELAGSIRRMKADVGDVELICIPKLRQLTVSTNLFGEVGLGEINELTDLCYALLNDGTLRYRLNKNGGKSWGADLKWGLYQGFAVDIYSATVDTWGCTMAIRTGCAEFSHKLVMERRLGGFCPNHLQFKDWRVRHRTTGELYETPEEGDVFRVLGIRNIDPAARTETARP